MTREGRIVSATLAAMLLLAALSAPVSVRLLQRPGALSSTWLIIALAANLTSVLLLALIAGVGGYFVSRLALNESAE